MKEKYDHRLLLKHLPSDLRVFLEHIQVYISLEKITRDKFPELCNNKIRIKIFTEFGVCR